jgi:hypothetical protein
MFTFIQSRLFARLFDELFSDEGLIALEAYLASNPEAGAVVPGSGGVRKMRWGAPGRGKRGGVRIIYYLKLRDEEIWFLTLYAKNETATIPGPILKQIKDEIDDQG